MAAASSPGTETCPSSRPFPFPELFRILFLQILHIFCYVYSWGVLNIIVIEAIKVSSISYLKWLLFVQKGKLLIFVCGFCIKLLYLTRRSSNRSPADCLELFFKWIITSPAKNSVPSVFLVPTLSPFASFVARVCGTC